MIRVTVVVEGLAAGTWTLDRSRKMPVVSVDLIEALDAAVGGGIEAEVTTIGRIFNTDVALEPES